jgi:predicted RNA-binding Zn-ribbon protein involved in translation (DUF1610 family)
LTPATVLVVPRGSTGDVLLGVRLIGHQAEGVHSMDSHEIVFQCPNCGSDLRQTIGRLKASEHMTCPGCHVGINIDTNRLANAAAEIQKAIEKVPPEITIKFFR